MAENKLDIAFCISNNYSNYIGVTILSICENNNNNPVNITFHIVTDYISDKNKKYLNEIICNHQNNKYFNLEFHIINDNKILGLSHSRFTKYTWYRILLPEVLVNQNKVLYLDADIIVEDSLNELASINLEKFLIAAPLEDRALESDHYKRLNYENNLLYICSGVLLMNLDEWRKQHTTSKIINWATENANILKFPDQDALNVICKDKKLVLPLKYGVVNWFFTNKKFYSTHFRNQLYEALEHPVIIHYTFTLPWYKDSQKHIFHDKWHKYNKKLKKPIKIKYFSKNMLFIKIFLYNLLLKNKNKYDLEIKRMMILEKLTKD